MQAAQGGMNHDLKPDWIFMGNDLGLFSRCECGIFSWDHLGWKKLERKKTIMTSQEIDQLEPGLGIDELIAKKIMDWNICGGSKKREDATLWWGTPGPAPYFNRPLIDTPYFSTQIDDAWQIVRKINDRGLICHIETYPTNGNYDEWCGISDGAKFIARAKGKTPELAICRASLKAVMGVKE